jgi:hypothetical protein
MTEFEGSIPAPALKYASPVTMPVRTFPNSTVLFDGSEISPPAIVQRYAPFTYRSIDEAKEIPHQVVIRAKGWKKLHYHKNWYLYQPMVSFAEGLPSNATLEQASRVSVLLASLPQLNELLRKHYKTVQQNALQGRVFSALSDPARRAMGPPSRMVDIDAERVFKDWGESVDSIESNVHFCGLFRAYQKVSNTDNNVDVAVTACGRTFIPNYWQDDNIDEYNIGFLVYPLVSGGPFQVVPWKCLKRARPTRKERTYVDKDGTQKLAGFYCIGRVMHSGPESKTSDWSAKVACGLEEETMTNRVVSVKATTEQMGKLEIDVGERPYLGPIL